MTREKGGRLGPLCFLKKSKLFERCSKNTAYLPHRANVEAYLQYCCLTRVPLLKMYRHWFSLAVTSILFFLLRLSNASVSSSSDILLHHNQRQRSASSKAELSIRPLVHDTYNKSLSSASDSGVSPVVGEGSHLGIIEEVRVAVSTAQSVAKSELAELELETQTTSTLHRDETNDKNLASLLLPTDRDCIRVQLPVPNPRPE